MPNPIERIFLGWDSPALAAAAGRLIDHYVQGPEIRLDRAAVVLPGRRAGRRLVELLVERAQERRLRLRPPGVQTVGTFPERLYEPERPVADRVLAARAWALALRRFDGDGIRTVFAQPPDPDDVVGWDRHVRELERLHREVGGAGLTFGDVADRCREGPAFDDSPRWDVLAGVQRSYIETLESLGRTDREFARLRALERRAIAGKLDIWLVGVADLAPVPRRMLRLLAVPVRALVHAPGDRADAFDEAGCVRPDAWQEAEIPLPDGRIAVGDRPTDQAVEALRAIAALDGRYTAEQVTIGVPDDTIVPYLEQRLSAHELPVRHAVGERPGRTEPHRLLAAIADYLDGHRFDALAALLRHPDLRRWWRRNAEADALLTVADAYYAETLPGRVIEPLAGEREATREPMARVLGAISGDALLGRLTGRRRLAAWAPELLELLVEVYGDEPPDRNDPSGWRLLESFGRLREAAAAFHGLPEALDEECTAATAIRLLLAEADRTPIPPEPRDAAVELLGWLELHLDDAPALVITGFNEPYVPESVNADVFLPNALRARLGLPDNTLRYARDAYQLTAILHSRPDVRVIAGRRDAAGDPLRPSRLLFAAPDRSVAERVLRFYEDEHARVAPPAPWPHGAESRFRSPPEPEIRAPAPLTSLRVTDFRRLLRDPYRFALERVLRLSPLHDEANELDGAAFGALAHHVLHRFARAGGTVRGTDADAARAALDALLDDAVARRFGRAVLPAVRVQVEQLRARLHAFAVWHAGWIEAGWRVVAVEAEPADGVPFDVDGEPVRLHGRIDRIDRHAATGEWALLDYKTSDRPTDPDRSHRAGRGDDRRWVDLQLPLYRHLLGALPLAAAPPDPDDVRLGYILLPRELDRVGDALADWDARELDAADEAARAAVRLVRDNRFVFDPDRVEVYRDDPLAALLGAGALVALADEADDGGADG